MANAQRLDSAPRRQRRGAWPRHRQLDWLTLAFAAAGALLVLFVLLPPLVTVLGTPFGDVAEAAGEPKVIDSVLLTFIAGLLATVAGALLGVPLAYLLARRRFRGKRLVEGLIDLPVVIPHTAAGIALLVVFGSKGVVGGPLGALGIRFTDNIAGIVVAMLFVSIPFLVNAAREAFAMVHPEMEKVAETLGATPLQAFLYVTLPLAWRGIVVGALMMWSRGISEFGAVVIIAYHPQIVPVLVYERFQGFGLHAAKPVAVILIVGALLVFVVVRGWLMRRDDEPLGLE
jgi:molybdate/tungstate transport system permease protein